MQVKNFGKVSIPPPSSPICINARHRVRSTPILPTKIHHQEDGVTRQNNPWVDQEQWEQQKQDVGTVEVHISVKTVLITISMIQWLLSQATRGDRGRGRIEDMVNKTEGRGAVLSEEIGISRAMRSKERRGVSMKRGHGMRGTPGDQRGRRKRGIERDIEVGVRVARGTGMGIVGEMIVSGTAIGIVIGIGTVIREIEGIRLVILYIRNQFSEHVPRAIITFRHLCSSRIYILTASRLTLIKTVMPSSSLPELHCRLCR